MVQFYKSWQPSAVSTQVTQMLIEVQSLVMDVTLPSATPQRNIQLKQSQTNITGDPKKVIDSLNFLNSESWTIVKFMKHYTHWNLFRIFLFKYLVT